MTVLLKGMSGLGVRLAWASRAVALAAAAAVLMAFLWTAHEAADPSVVPGPGPRGGVVAVTDGVDAGVVGVAIHRTKPPLDAFSLPTAPALETSRQALNGPPPPPPAAARPAVPLQTDPSWVALGTAARSYVAPPAQSGAWSSLRTPAGPPAA
ncbi:hypothetical protein [Azospirillum sp. ST 5-10]|uniref:hypothetical protein n=1 Tax=unclassified Azospirillum TaxID=2630922 RepID=UPI003F4A0D56